MHRNVGFDSVAQAMCGSVYMTGEPEQPYRATAPWVDFGTALHCAFGTMAALMERQKTGKGQMVTGALLATALTVNNAALIEQALIKPDRIPTRNRGQTAAPADIYKARDGWVLVAVTGQPLYARWAKLMGEAHWLTDARFVDDEARAAGTVNHQRAHGPLVRRAQLRRSHQILGEAKIPCAPVLTQQQALDHPQVKALDVLQDTDYPGLPRPAPVAAVPIWMTETKPVKRRRPPLLGEHTDEILGEFGYSGAEIAALREQSVI
jgi:crotonobetainyl-CoA:carnitine CoA-transferase CaiB-like acyl-CoA transferase